MPANDDFVASLFVGRNLHRNLGLQTILESFRIVEKKVQRTSLQHASRLEHNVTALHRIAECLARTRAGAGIDNYKLARLLIDSQTFQCWQADVIELRG